MKRNAFGYSDWMVIGLIVWLCLVPVILLLALPILGATSAWMAMGALLVVVLALCLLVCRKMLML